MMQALPVLEVSAGGIFSLLIIREVLNFVQNRKNGKQFGNSLYTQHDKWTNMFREVHELYEMHNVKDPDGVPVWYVRRSLETAIVKLTEVIEKVGTNMDRLSEDTTAMRDEMREIHRRGG